MIIFYLLNSIIANTHGLCHETLNRCYSTDGFNSQIYECAGGTAITLTVYHTTTDCTLPDIPPPGTGDGATSSIEQNSECCPGTVNFSKKLVMIKPQSH